MDETRKKLDRDEDAMRAQSSNFATLGNVPNVFKSGPLTQQEMADYFFAGFEGKLRPPTKLRKKEDSKVDILQALRKQLLSEDDQLLVKHGLMTESGLVTDLGKDAVLDSLFAKAKPELVAGLKKIEDANDKKKK